MDYPNHPALVTEATTRSIQDMMDGNAVWVGSPEHIAQCIETYQAGVGVIDSAPIQANFYTLSLDQASASLRLFAERVMPCFN